MTAFSSIGMVSMKFIGSFVRYSNVNDLNIVFMILPVFGLKGFYSLPKKGSSNMIVFLS